MLKILSTTITLSLVAFSFYTYSEASLVGAATDSDTVEVNLTVTEEIAIDAPADENMTALTASVNESTGDVTWTVTTNAASGYILELDADTDPAMQSGSDSFADYTEGTPGTPEAWSVTSAYEFGVGAYGDDVPNGTWGAGSSCGAGTIPADINYRGFDSGTAFQVASSGTETSTSGTAATVCFAAEQQGVFAPSGSYNATITATATTQ